MPKKSNNLSFNPNGLPFGFDFDLANKVATKNGYKGQTFKTSKNNSSSTKQKREHKPLGETIGDILGFAKTGAGIFSEVKSSFKNTAPQNFYTTSPGNDNSQNSFQYPQQPLFNSQSYRNSVPLRQNKDDNLIQTNGSKSRHTTAIIIGVITMIIIIYLFTQGKTK